MKNKKKINIDTDNIALGLFILCIFIIWALFCFLSKVPYHSIDLNIYCKTCNYKKIPFYEEFCNDCGINKRENGYVKIDSYCSSCNMDSKKTYCPSCGSSIIDVSWLPYKDIPLWYFVIRTIVIPVILLIKILTGIYIIFVSMDSGDNPFYFTLMIITIIIDFVLVLLSASPIVSVFF